MTEAQTNRRERPAEPILRPFVGIAYRVEEAARMIAISKSTLWARIKDGRIPVKRDGGSTIILHRDLEAYIDALPYDVRKSTR